MNGPVNLEGENVCGFNGCRTKVPIERSYCDDCWHKLKTPIHYAKNVSGLKDEVDYIEGTTRKTTIEIIVSTLLEFLLNI